MDNLVQKVNFYPKKLIGPLIPKKTYFLLQKSQEQTQYAPSDVFKK